MWELFDMHQYAYGHVVQQATHEQKKKRIEFYSANPCINFKAIFV